MCGEESRHYQLPIFIYISYFSLKKMKINWDRIYFLSTLSMLAVFLIAPLREEIYPWYVIWILSLAVLVPKSKVLLSLATVLSLSTLLRYIPVLYTGSYFGLTPQVKEFVTFVPIGILCLFWLWRKTPRRLLFQ